MNIESLKKLIATSQAVYVKIDAGDFKLQLTTSDGGFTDKEAEDFVSRYEMAAPFETKTSGLQAILFHDKIDNKFVFP